jgi:putative ABC transport system permease protein
LPVPDATLEQVHGELETLWQATPARSSSTEAALRVQVVPLNDLFTTRVTTPVWLAFMTVGVLLLMMACFNVANLLLARAVRREREMSIRRALGASAGRIVRQLLTESALLAGLGGALGLGLAAAGLRLFTSAIPEDGLPYWLQYSMDATVVAGLAAACVGTVLLFGLAPALLTVRRRSGRTFQIAGVRSGTDRGVRRWTTVLLTVQLAVSVMLLTAVAGTVRALLSPDKGWSIDGAGLVTMRLAVDPGGLQDEARRADLLAAVRERLRAVPGVSSAAIASALPGAAAIPRRLTIEGREGSAAAAPRVSTVLVDHGYFDTLRMPLSRGRPFIPDDGRAAGSPVAIVNDVFARMYFPAADALGGRIALWRGDEQGPWITIVGVSPSVSHGTSRPAPAVYVPMDTTPGPAPVLLLRARGPIGPVVAAARAEVARLDPSLALYQIRSYDEAIRNAGWNGRLSNALITTLALIALCLAASGLAALTWHGVTARRHELGLRSALGSQPGAIVRLVLRSAARQVFHGLAAGCMLTLLWERLFGTPGLFFTLSNLVIVGGIFAAVSLAMCAWPAWMAAHVSPLAILQHE